MANYEAVLFDLDGTLVDTRAASWPLFAQTNAKFELGLDTREQFFAIFEGNFFESLARHIGDEEKTAAVGRHFMELIREHYAPPFIDGIVDVVRALATTHTLAVVSSNMHSTILRLLRSGGIDQHFVTIYAGDTQPSKSAAIADFLRGGWQSNGAERRFAPTQVVLVTDTSGDVGEARASGIDAIGVDWGMHSENKLVAAGAQAVASAPRQLLQWINR